MAIYKDTQLAEQPIYGSSRLGQYTGRPEPGKRIWQSKKYELSNHLGNVLAVVGDGYTTTSGDKEAWISSLQDYYPFGLAMEGRSSNLGGYRYGFNGKERDPATEWGQTSYDYGFRIYNPGIGKFLSVDPLTSSYPMLTPYQFSSNSPIVMIDVDGLEGQLYPGQYDGYSPFDANQNRHVSKIERQTGLKIIGYTVAAGALIMGGTLAAPIIVKGSIASIPKLTASATAITAWIANPRNQQLVAEGGAFVAGIIDPNPTAEYSMGYSDELGNFVGGLFRTSGDKILKYVYRGTRNIKDFEVGKATLSEGIVEFVIDAGELKGSDIGKHIFTDAINYFGDKVDGIKAVWTMDPAYPNNMAKGLKQFKETYDAFYGVLDHKEAALKAAKETDLYKLAKDRGFSKVEVDFVAEDEVGVTFSKE